MKIRRKRGIIKVDLNSKRSSVSAHDNTESSICTTPEEAKLRKEPLVQNTSARNDVGLPLDATIQSVQIMNAENLKTYPAPNLSKDEEESPKTVTDLIESNLEHPCNSTQLMI
jgi:hypothetical protein